MLREGFLWKGRGGLDADTPPTKGRIRRTICNDSAGAALKLKIVLKLLLSLGIL
jgi:hypothetical protein